MKKFGILVDSSVSLTQEQAHALNVVVAPLTLTYNQENFEDQVSISYNDVKSILSRHETLTTSQPNIGRILELLEDMKAQKYDHIFVLSLASSLSGTYSAFNHAVKESGIKDISVIDTYTLGGPVWSAIHLIRSLEAKDASVIAVLKAIDELIDHTSTYVYPQDLRQLKASGRISSGAATLAALLKIKPVLRFENHGKTIEKFATARTEAKAFDIILDDLKENGVTQDGHLIYILEFEANDVTMRFIERVHRDFPHIEIIRLPLPAAVATHAGIGTIAVQWTLKNDLLIANNGE